jgi:hypothetical protein
VVRGKVAQCTLERCANVTLRVDAVVGGLEVRHEMKGCLGSRTRPSGIAWRPLSFELSGT